MRGKKKARTFGGPTVALAVAVITAGALSPRTDSLGGLMVALDAVVGVAVAFAELSRRSLSGNRCEPGLVPVAVRRLHT